jgi:hypothetical protein
MKCWPKVKLLFEQVGNKTKEIALSTLALLALPVVPVLDVYTLGMVPKRIFHQYFAALVPGLEYIDNEGTMHEDDIQELEEYQQICNICKM